MKLVIQRVSEAKVHIDGEVHDFIGQGLLVLLGIHQEDTEDDRAWCIRKLLDMRIFSDEKGLMNLSLKDVKGDLMVISQFTLYASTKKGNRPSFIVAARPEQAIPMYEGFLDECSKERGKPVHSGVFGADMKVDLINDGPVTIIIDSRQKD
jgi:D-tyrosyl-tRNA(Tyr) deacylase